MYDFADIMTAVFTTYVIASGLSVILFSYGIDWGDKRRKEKNKEIRRLEMKSFENSCETINFIKVKEYITAVFQRDDTEISEFRIEKKFHYSHKRDIREDEKNIITVTVSFDTTEDMNFEVPGGNLMKE